MNNNLNLLIVDDDKNLLSVLKTILTEENHNVSTCSDGQTAIDMCGKTKFDLVITDLIMPGISGLEVLREVRRLNPDSLVILITGFGSLETAVQAIREGAYDYITKPFKLDEIKIIVNHAGEKISLIRENRNLISKLQEAYRQLQTINDTINNSSKNQEGCEKKITVSGVPEEDILITGGMLPLYYTEGLHQPVLSHLERVATLKEKGYLTEEEFNLCKSKLFRNIRH